MVTDTTINENNRQHILVFAVGIFFEFNLTRFLGELAWCAPVCDTAILNWPSLDIVSLSDGSAKHELRYKE